MSEEVFELLCGMDRKKVELQIVLQCAPTIAGLKTSNLLILPKDMEDKARIALRHTGLLGYRLVYDRHRVVFLVFNKEKLVKYLKQNEVRKFLKEYGYCLDGFGECLRLFQKRYELYVRTRKGFPHEMGVFLGYPLCDVRGFIDNGGDSYKASGYWKVYANINETQMLFKRFDDIKDEMVCKISEGYTLMDILREQQMVSIAS